MVSNESDSKMLGLKPNDLIGEWIVIRKLGMGGCGAVFEVCSKTRKKFQQVSLQKRRNERYAMKVESRDLDHSDQLLRSEASILKRLKHSAHVPLFISSGKTAMLNYILMELLGKSLSELHRAAYRKQFPMLTVLKIALQGLEALKDLHMVFFVHRDVKPANFDIGMTNVNMLYILDFGLSRQFAIYDEKENKFRLRRCRRKASFRGTVAYCSINVHKNREQGRHDDIWSLMYMLIEFITGRLPWKGLERMETAAIKETISQQRLLQNCPKQFGVIMNYLSRLKYHHRPNYRCLESLFRSAAQVRKIDLNAPFEWNDAASHRQPTSSNQPCSLKLANISEKLCAEANVTGRSERSQRPEIPAAETVCV